MQNLARAVKRRLGGGCVILLVAAGFFSCATTRTPASNSNYLAMNLPVERFEELRQQIQRDSGEKLKSRGEAHVTVITPPEFEVLRDHVRMNEIEKISRQVGFSESDLTYLCVGHGQKNEGSRLLKTYYVIVESPALLKIRRQIEQLNQERGGHGFKADHFYPHVTVGFTLRDLHEEEGVIKDMNSCDPRWKF